MIAVCVAWNALFIGHGIAWLFDEGWPLYASMRLEHGGVLYDDVFFPFPPGHLAPAWVARALFPPGIVAARVIYAAFDVALCASLYALGRRLMPARFALLGALLVAVASPRGHLAHYLFGYRYLVWSVVCLLCLDRRLRGGGARWMIAAGAFAGVALGFRLAPAFSVTCAALAAVASVAPNARRAGADMALYGAGLLAAAAPALVWIQAGAGLPAAWHGIVAHIAELQLAQSLPVPTLAPPAAWTRASLVTWFVAAQYRIYPLLFAGYTAVVLAKRVRSGRSGGGFDDALLLAVAVWGGVNFLRTLGRSDEGHLVSALPPACLLLAHLLATALRAPRRPVVERLAIAAFLALWIVLLGSDRYLGGERRGRQSVASIPGVRIGSSRLASEIDAVVKALREETAPGETVLNLAYAPLFHVLADRPGPGGLDVVLPGTFLDAQEEAAFVARLEAAPPAAVILRRRPFDGLPSRSLAKTAPRVDGFVRDHYAAAATRGRFVVLLPKERPASRGP